MATTGFAGRTMTVDYASTTLVGVRTRGISITSDPIDITTDDDAGWRTLLATPALRSVEVTVAGVTGDEILLAAILAGSPAFATIDVNLGTGNGDVSMSGYLSAYEISGNHDGALEFTATFMSSGAPTYTASA